jgi:hypothetical protein
MPQSISNRQDVELHKQLAALQALHAAQGTVLKTQADMFIVAHLCRLVETLIDGEPKTPLPQRGHP